MGNEDRRDFIVKEGACAIVRLGRSTLCSPLRQLTWHTCNTVLYLYTLFCVASLAGGKVTLKVGDAILMRVDDLTVQGVELGGDDLQEILEHVLRF
jgi:hypothetical protein